MKNKTLMGIGKRVIPVPLWIFKAVFLPVMKIMKMVFPIIFSEDHYKVRDFLITELIRLQKPVSPEHIAEKLNMPRDRVEEILKKIAARQIWSVRNAQGNVTWTYPITVEETKFKISFNTGQEQLWGP
jgi:hypothetical protein